MDAELRPVLIEQYKLATEMADRLSARRGTANGFFLAVSSALLAASESFGLPMASAAGIVLAATWWSQLRSYRRLSAAKWAVINQLEAALPAQPFLDEWAIVKAEPLERVSVRLQKLGRVLQPLARYTELSIAEQVVPVIFVALFIVALARGVS